MEEVVNQVQKDIVYKELYNNKKNSPAWKYFTCYNFYIYIDNNDQTKLIKKD